MKVGQLIGLTNGDLAIPKFIGSTNIVYDLWFQNGDDIEVKRVQARPDYENAKTIKEFTEMVKTTTDLFHTGYTNANN